MRPRYLTKSLFNLAMECPTKLYYAKNPAYADRKIEDTFLMALADGGFQVGELAKCYFPGGHYIKVLDYEEALRRTDELLKQEQVIIYEAAIRYKNFFIRTDILVKDKDKIELIEVKAKSIAEADDAFFLNKNGSISAGWKPYLLDVAFQKHVLQGAFPEYDISAFLMLAEKKAKCPTDGLNQKFKITKNEAGRKQVTITGEITPEDLFVPILCKVDADPCCEIIFAEEYYGVDGKLSFAGYVDELANYYVKDEKISPVPTAACGVCEFVTDPIDEKAGLKSGFKECWKGIFGWTDEDFKEPTIFDIWNFRRKDRYIKVGRVKLAELTEEDISPKKSDKPGISPSMRQWLQVRKTQAGDKTVWIDKESLKWEMDNFVFPLHFIDFETTMVAIPFNKGRHPYEGIAFQYSHHIVHEDGRIAHQGEYLNTEPGVFPSYDFLRALKKELEGDQGSIFRYAAHENTYLNLIYRQLREDSEKIPDREELCEFIRSITKAVRHSEEQWVGPRNMIDMLELVKRYYYDPAMRGSNSIKKVLPAILNSSPYLQEKYSQRIYGSEGGIPSLNYKDWKWIEFEDGQVIDPYKLLPKMFQDVSDKDLSLLSDSDELKDGGAALTAYARMQFEEMSAYEREEIRKALLKYCELDTMAMVMIYEGWREMVKER